MKTRISKRVVVLAAALVVVLPAGLFARGQGNTDGLEMVRIGVMTDSIVDYAVQIGNAEGIWAKYGLRIESANFAMGINTIDAVSTGNMDIAYGADFAVLNRFGGSQSNPLRILVTVGESRPDSWQLYALGNDIQSAKDLAGKSVVTQLGTVVEYWLAKILVVNGVDTKTLKFLPVESPMEGVALIQSGQASAMWASTTAGQRLAAINGVHSISDLAPTGAPTLSFLLATEEFLTTRQAATVKLLQAYQDIFDFMKNNTQRAAELINKNSGTPVQQIANNLKDAIIYVDFTQKNYSDAEALYSWMLANGVIKIPYSLRDVIRTDALKTAFPGRGNFN